jgi:hypothetical protein
MVPTTEPAKRIAVLFKRRLTTAWAPKEIEQYRKLVKDGHFQDLDDLELIERYYVFERRKEDKGIHRRELQTFLNNYLGELDRARQWDARFRRPIKGRYTNQPKPISDDEFKRIGELARGQLEEFRKRLNHEIA